MRRFPESLLATLVCILVGSAPANAATFHVQGTGLAWDINPGDGICMTQFGACSFPAALAEANALPGPDTIVLPGGTWPAPTFGFRVEEALEIRGVGSGTTAQTILGGGNVNRVINSSAALNLIGLTIRNGRYTNTGGGVRQQDGPLLVRDCVFYNNRAGNTGGGIRATADLTIEDSTFYNNHAGNTGAVVSANGTVNVNNSTFFDNTAGNTGAVISIYGTLTVDNSTFTANRAGNTGGALRVHDRAYVNNSTFFDNTAGNTGGAISTAGVVHLNNVTISGNTGTALRGSEGGRFTIANTILWGNSSECSASGGIVSNGNNLFDPDVCEMQNGFQPTDIIGQDPLLGALQNNGGPTDTMLPDDGSPAIDAGGAGCESHDQRGIPRPQGASCDIGAVEKIACNYDGVVDPGEQCDDGNTVDGDGCSALCETELISGHNFRLKADAGSPSRAKMIAITKDERIRLGWGNGSADDPVLHGATLRVVSHEGEGIDLSFYLPAENWDYIGRAGANRGYRYKDRDGTVQKVKVRPGKGIKVKAKGTGMATDLGDNPDPVHFFLSIGAREFCTSFGGEVKYKLDRLYKARTAPAPASQPPL